MAALQKKAGTHASLLGSVLAGSDSFLSRAFKSVTIISSAALLILFMIFSYLVQLLSIPLLFLSPVIMYRLNSFFAGTMWRLCQHMFEDQNGLRIRVTGMERIPFGESALVISNHRSFLDFAMIHAVSEKRGMLGNCRYFVKDSVKYWPFFGWGMYLAGFIFLKRNWERDQRNISATFKALTTHNLPVHLISFLEGHRFSAEKLKQSHQYAAKSSLPLFENTLLPRTKGFIASVRGLRHSHINHVYDLTLAFFHRRRGFGATPSLFDFLFGRMNEYQYVVHVDRYAMSELPHQDADIALWLIKLYEHKNKLLLSMKHDWDRKNKYNK